jgi:spermidine synthase
MKKFLLDISVFLCGAIVMVYELVGSRVLAPYIGNSIYVWTSLIGIILGSLSLGYYLGGKLADRVANYKHYSLIIFISAICIGFTLIIKEPLLSLIKISFFGVESTSLLLSLLLFAPASILLGIISPYAVKLRIQDLQTSGKVVGNLYAISTLGSIVGTFLAGYFLIPLLGTDNILLLLLILLVILSVIIYPKSFSVLKFILLIIFIIIFLFIAYKAKAVVNIIDLDSQYNRIWIYQTNNVLHLRTDPYGVQSSMFLNSDELTAEYTKYYRLAAHFQPNLKKALMIGGCAYSYPKDFLVKFPQAEMDVVEIDPKMTELAKKYFRLKDNPRLHIFHEDGRTFLNNTTNQYDAIYVDAFSSVFTIPFQLTTKEAVQKEYDILNKEGVVVVNIPSAINGDKGNFLQAEYETYKSIFPQVYLFLVQDPDDSSLFQNIMLIALKSDNKPVFNSSNPELNGYLQHLYKEAIITSEAILTDDFAPVEYYVRKFL